MLNSVRGSSDAYLIEKQSSGGRGAVDHGRCRGCNDKGEELCVGSFLDSFITQIVTPTMKNCPCAHPECS